MLRGSQNNAALLMKAKEPQPKVVEIEPIENYQGKTIQELEAILDGYKASQGGAPASTAAPSKPPFPMNKDLKPLEEQKHQAPVPPKRLSRYNSQNRGQAVQNASANAPLKKGQSADRRTRPPVGQTSGSNKENTIELRKNYGKVPKYLQKFAKEKEEMQR